MSEETLHYKNPIVFFNPKSAGGKTAKKFETIKAALGRAAFGFERVTFAETKKDRAENNEVIHHALETKNYDLIITIGGDGTISSVVNGMYILPQELHLPIMPIPFGSGNSVLREFGIMSIDDAAARYQSLTAPKDFDLLLCENDSGFKYYCINLLGMGFISDVVVEVLKFHKKFGAFSYVVGIMSALNRFRAYKVKMTIGSGDSQSVVTADRGQFLTLSNTQFSGGGIQIAPNAKYNDGLMDVVLLHDLSKFSFLQGFAKTFKGKHVGRKGCDYIQTDRIIIETEPPMMLMPDGELEGQTPITVSVIPKAVKIVV